MTSSKRDVLQNSPTIFIVVATHRKSLSPTGLLYLMPLPSVTSVSLLLRLSYAPKQPPYWVGSGNKAPYLQAPTALLHSQPALLQSLWKVCVPSSAHTNSLAVSSLAALNLWIHMNHPWPIYNLTTPSSGMTTFVSDSPHTRCPSHAQVYRPPSCLWPALVCDWWLSHLVRSRSHLVRHPPGPPSPCQLLQL